MHISRRRLLLALPAGSVAAPIAPRATAGAGGRMRRRQPLGCSIVPVHLGEPQRQAQTFFSRAVCRSDRTMP